MRTTVWIVLELWTGEQPSVDVDGVYADEGRARRRQAELMTRHEGLAITVSVVGKFVST
jgi:hypothetical protein